VLTGCRFTLPLQVLTPLALGGDASVVSMLNPTGAVLGGDRLRVDVHVGGGARATLTTPSATKVYRADGPPAEQDVRLFVGDGGTLEWIPDHTIPFPGSAFRQRLHARLAPGARLIVADAFAAGRVARGERWRFRHLESALTVVDEHGWLLHDRFVLRGDGWSGLGYTEGLPYFATVLVIVDEVDDACEAVRAAVAAPGGVRAAVARLPRRGLLVRCLAPDAPALESTIRGLWNAVRPAALGARAVDLRKY
jgi:urease accessory protein